MSDFTNGDTIRKEGMESRGISISDTEFRYNLCPELPLSNPSLVKCFMVYSN